MVSDNQVCASTVVTWIHPVDKTYYMYTVPMREYIVHLNFSSVTTFDETANYIGLFVVTTQIYLILL